MSDLIDIGISVNTAELADAKVKLEALKPAAAGASAATQKLAKAVEGTSRIVNKAAVDAARAGLRQAESSYAQARAVENAAAADIKAAKASRDKARAVLASVKAEQANALAAASSAAAMTEYANAAALAKRTSPVANDKMPNRFNTANIAAQFQDIGVTASMGMNPMTIALQQGTQLSAILNSMESPLKGIAAAFRSVFNPVSLLSIGLVALVAALIQMTDWVKVGQSILNTLANGLEHSAEAVGTLSEALVIAGVAFVAFRIALAAVNYQATWNAITGIVVSLYQMAAAALSAGAAMVTAWIAANAPLAILLVSIAGVSAALYAIFGEKFLTSVKTGVNFLIGAAVGAFNAVVTLFSSLPEIFHGIWEYIANDLYRTLVKSSAKTTNFIAEMMGADLRVTIPEFDTKPFQNSASKVLKQITTDFQKDLTGVDYVGAIGKGVESGVNYAAGKMRELSTYIGLPKDGKDKKKKAGKTDEDKFGDIVKGAQRNIQSLKAEQAALGMTAEAAAKLKYETDLLNEAQQKGITLTFEQKLLLSGLAGEMAGLQEQTRKTEEAMDFLKTSTKGFFDDMKSGLEEGKGLWNSFLDAVTNVLNRLTDKIFEMQMDNMFQDFGNTGSGQGFLGQVMSLFGGGGSDSTGLSSGAIDLASQGGLYTNNVISSPTLFGFAKGDSFGVMGESGAEAVMPLHRGSDGSLGVRVEGGGAGGSGSVTIVNVNNNSKASASVQQRETSNGTEIDVMIEEIVAGKISERGSSANRSVKAVNSQAMIRR